MHVRFHSKLGRQRACDELIGERERFAFGWFARGQNSQKCHHRCSVPYRRQRLVSALVLQPCRTDSGRVTSGNLAEEMDQWRLGPTSDIFGSSDWPPKRKEWFKACFECAVTGVWCCESESGTCMRSNHGGRRHEIIPDCWPNAVWRSLITRDISDHNKLPNNNHGTRTNNNHSTGRRPLCLLQAGIERDKELCVCDSCASS